MTLGAVRKNALTTKASDAAVEQEIKEWLKFAPVRIKEKAKREHAKLQKRDRRN